MSQTGDGDVRSEMSGRAGDVVQARDVSGGVHFHQRISVIPRPSQLPGQHAAFVDRQEAIALLNATLVGGDPRRAVIVGMPGAGKTTLAVHWAYRNLPSYLSRPLVSIGDLVADLRRQSALWRALTIDEHAQWDEPVFAHSVFAWSYQALPETAARVFRSLSLHPGPDFSEAAVVALAGQTAPGQSLDILVGAHLLERPAGDRYQFHDLVRSYAVDQAREEDPPERRHAATRRLLLWYLRSADAAQPHVNPKEARVPIEPIRGDEPRPKSFGSDEEAVEWFDREHGNLLASVTVAGEHGLHEIAWKLAVVLRAFHMRFSMVEDWLTASGAGLRSAEAVDDLAAQGELLESMGMAYSQAYDLDRSEEYLTRALQIRRQVRDQHSLALTLNSLGLLHVRRHHLNAARSVFQEALDIYAELEDKTWVPVIRENLAEALIGLGHSPTAETLVLDALADLKRRGDIGSQGNALRLLSMARRDRGDLDRARAAAEEAVTLAIQQRHPGREGYWLLELGTVQCLSGELATAQDSFGRAADLLHRAGKPRPGTCRVLSNTRWATSTLRSSRTATRRRCSVHSRQSGRWPSPCTT